MTEQEHIHVFDSQGEAYKQAFQIFLDHTGQKRNAKRWLQQVVNDLPMRQVFIDAMAGIGEVTRAFDRTIAIEPNAYLLNQLRQTVMTAEAIGKPRRVLGSRLCTAYVLHRVDNLSLREIAGHVGVSAARISHIQTMMEHSKTRKQALAALLHSKLKP